MERGLNLRWLYALRAIMTLGTVTQAAQYLYVTQPAVSRMIANLEAEIGFELFVRDRGRLVPTPQGERFYREVERVLVGVGDINSIARDIRDNKGDRLRIVAMSAIANGLLPAALGSFLTTSPDVTISLQVRSRRDVEHWVAGQQFDIGIAVLPIEHPTITCHPFINVDVVAVLPKGHPLAKQRELRLEDLALERFITMPSHTLFRQEIDNVVQKNSFTLQAGFETSSLDLAFRMAANGLGITAVDLFTLGSFLDTPVEVRQIIPTMSRTFGFLLPAERPPTKLTSHFMDLVSSTAESLILEVRQRTGLLQI